MRIAILLAFSLAMAGCLGSTGPLSEAEARTAAQAALADFEAAFEAEDGGDLRMVTGDFHVPEQEDDFGFGPFDGRFELELGSNDVTRVAISISAGSGGSSFTYQMEAYCTSDGQVVVFGDDTYEARDGAISECDEIFSDPEGFEESPTDCGDPSREPDTVTPHDDGSVTAVYEGEEATCTIEVDAKGRLVAMTITSGDFEGTFTVDWGRRQAIEVPAADERFPAGVSGFGTFPDGAYHWSAYGAEGEYPLDEFEVRILDGESGEVVATFDLGTSGTQAGFIYTFEGGGPWFDEDDGFTVSHPDWTSQDQYDVVVWDTWADRDIEDLPIPGVGLLAVLGLLGLVAARRR